MRCLVLIITILLSPSVYGQHPDHKGAAPARKIIAETGLGNVNHTVSTRNRAAQQFFNQGLSYVYGFNHQEAINSFKRAAELDPELAMAYWGVALASGSNYNVAADVNQLRDAWGNLLVAQRLAPNASAAERDYIEALSKRYASDPSTDAKKLAYDYKKAMGDLARKYPNDLDAATLYAESMMNLHPWQLWDLDGKPAEGTLEIISVLEGVLRRDPKHPGANHYYIHAVEASPNPSRALASAKRLGAIAPKAGHLVHMPSHIYIRTGDYNLAAKSNAAAIIADQEYIRKAGSNGLYPMMYYNHNVHFLASANAMIGRYSDAIRNAQKLEASVRPHLAAMPMLEGFSYYPLITMVRFHKWGEIKAYPEPANKGSVTAAIRQFARGIAFAETGNAAEANKELSQFRETLRHLAPDLALGNNAASTLLRIPEKMLEGEIALARGDKRSAIDLLKAAVAVDDKVNYDEPPDWDLPVREWLGRVLLMNAEYGEAERVYRDELAKHPNNGRALFGLAESLRKQNKTADASRVTRDLARQWARADTRLTLAYLYK